MKSETNTDPTTSAEEEIKVLGKTLHDKIEALGKSPEIEHAKAKVHEAIMWAFKHIKG